jgi:transposase
LTDLQRAEIAEHYRAGELRSELAAIYGLSTGTVSTIFAAHGATRSRG